MDPNEPDLEALDEAQYLLERMLEMAERSASDDCPDTSRPRLQKGFKMLQGLLGTDYATFAEFVSKYSFEDISAMK